MSTADRQAHVIRRLAIFGAGGFGREVAWLAESALGAGAEVTFLVDHAEHLTGPVNGIPVALLADYEPRGEGHYVVAVGDPAARRKIAAKCEAHGLQAAPLVHPGVLASRWVQVAPGAVICAGSILTTNIEVRAHVHINLDCTIGHDVVIHEFATLSPGVHLSGNVVVGPGVFIGTGAVVINGNAGQPLTLGEGAVIAAGACVTRDVEPGALVAGVPAIRKR